jgi:hypothetical protein
MEYWSYGVVGMEYWNNGMIGMEYWNNGVMECRKTGITPLLHYSITPLFTVL